jgi:cytochrome b
VVNRDAAKVRVWDLPVRALHWGLVAAVATAAFTSEWFTRFHEVAGYAAMAVLAARVAWGVCGSRYARFTQFVRAPRATWRYARAMRAGREPRYLGHNPVGGWMVVALMACLAGLGFTGWLYTTEEFWGEPWLDRLHAALAWVLLALVSGHLAGVLFTSLRHRENLVAAMLSGDKAAPADDDVC